MTPEKRRQFAKSVIKWTVSTCAGATASAVLKANLPVTDKTTQKVAFVVGTFVLGSMTKDKASAWADGEVDELYELIDKINGKSEDAPEE